MTSLVLDAKGCTGGLMIVEGGTEVAVQVYVYMLHDFCLSERLMALCGWLDAGDAFCKGHAEGLDAVSDDGCGCCAAGLVYGSVVNVPQSRRQPNSRIRLRGIMRLSKALAWVLFELRAEKQEVPM